MKKVIFASLAILAIVAGCAKNEFDGKVRTHSGITEVTATIPDQTKTYLSDDKGTYRLFWFEEETISVGAGETFSEFTLKEGADSPVGKFESSQDLPVADYYYAVSPAMVDVKEADGKLTVFYPSEISYQAESGNAEGGEIMVAKSSSAAFSFQNAIGYLKFQLAVEEEEVIDKIEISDNNGNPITGEAVISFSGSAIDSIKFASGAGSTLSVAFNTPVTITTAQPFVTFIPVAPMPNGATFTITMKSGKSMTVKSTTAVEKNKIIELPALTFKPIKVAKVEGTEYYSLKQAVEAAGDLGKDVTIQIINDCNVGANCELLSLLHEITLDLNGHTLYGVGDNYLTVGRDTKNVIIMDSSSEQTGTITNRNNGSTPFRVYGHTTMKSGNIVSGKNYGVYVQGGSFVMEGGTINSGSTGIYARPLESNLEIDSISVSGDAKIISVGSGVNLNSETTELFFRGGDIQAKGVAVYVYDAKSLQIFDGTFGSKTNVIYANRSYKNQVDIYGGKFHRDSINAIVYCHATTDSARVWGGYYNSSVSSSYIPEGYTVSGCDTTIDGRKYTVTITKSAEIQASVSIDGGAPIEKATINDAFKTAIESGKSALITLLADCAPTDSMVLKTDNKITVDFNGKTLTCNSDKVFRVVGENSDITFKSSVEGGGINQTSSGTGCMAIRQRGGKVTLESGIYGGTGNQYTFYTTGGEIIFNGGEFYADSNVIWVSNAKLYVNGGKFIHRTTSTKETIKQIYVTTNGEALFNGGEFEGVYVYNSNTKATFVGGNYPSFTLSGGCNEIAIEDGTFQNIHFEQTGTVTVKGGTFNGRSYMDGTGTLNIEGGTFTNTSGNYQYAMWPTAGKINIKGGTFTGGTSYGTLRFTKCIATIEDGATINSTASDGNAVYVGHADYKGTLTINGGTFNSPKAIYARKGTLLVNGGIFNCTGTRTMYIDKDIQTNVLGGYFNTTEETVLIEGDGLAGVLKGGWFNKPVTEAAINPSYILDNTKSTEVAGVTYNYHVIENASSPDIATVNGVGYKSIATAIAAAAEYSGADAEVVIKVVSPEDTVSINTTSDFTNANGKPVTLDFNNHVINGVVDSLIVTTGVLTLTDNSVEKGGRLASDKRRIIALNKVGTVYIKHITIDNTRGGMGYDTAMYSLITVVGTSSANSAALHISDGAKLLALNHWIKYIYVSYGTLTTENCEIITKNGGTSTNGAYPCIWAYSGANITVKSGTFLQANGEGNTRGALYIGTGNTSIGSIITVEDGAMIWSDSSNGAIGSGSSSGVPFASKTLHLNGGYVNAFKAEYLPIFPEGKSLQAISPAKEYTNCAGQTKSFGYQVK